MTPPKSPGREDIQAMEHLQCCPRLHGPGPEKIWPNGMEARMRCQPFVPAPALASLPK